MKKKKRGQFFLKVLWPFFVEFVVIHNGIITNYKDLKAFLVGLKGLHIYIFSATIFEFLFIINFIVKLVMNSVTSFATD